MVKNLGGNKAKGYARKNCGKSDNVLRVAEEEGEVYAQVTKIFGGKMCQVIALDGTIMNCHIRGNFSRSRGRRDNFIDINTWVIVGLREWENQEAKGKTLNCDLLEVYNDTEKNKLKNNVTNVNWSRFIANDNKTIGGTTEVDPDDEFSGFTFADEATIEYQEFIKKQLQDSTAGVNNNILDTNQENQIDADDI
jgi:translation initiation factor IF-1